VSTAVLTTENWIALFAIYTVLFAAILLTLWHRYQESIRQQRHLEYAHRQREKDVSERTQSLRAINSELYQEIQRGQRQFLHFEIDTDGDCRPVIEVYREIGVNSMNPFEVAAGCDVVEIGRAHPDLVMRGGIDKHVLRRSRAAIVAELVLRLAQCGAHGH